MPENLDNQAGGELIQTLNKLTSKKAQLRQDYQKALKKASDATTEARIIKVQIAQITDEIAACKYNVKAEKD